MALQISIQRCVYSSKTENKMNETPLDLKLDKKDFLEDSLLNKETIKLIIDEHSSWYSVPKVELVLRHKVINGKEVDGLVLLKFQRCRRLVGVELKEWNIGDCISQAVERRKLFNYSYIITRFPRHSLGSIIRDILNSENGTYGQYFQELFKYKIGWIVYDKKYPPLLMFPSFFLKEGLDLTNLTFIKNLKNKVVDVEMR